MNPTPVASTKNAIHNATDAELLMRFVRARDERCFEAIVTRYTPLVYRVCRTVLLNPADAEDAYQATFLILVRKAKCLMAVQSLGAWLYKVAHRLSVRANLSNRKKSHGQLESEPESEIDQFHLISRKEILSGVFEEMSRLPTKYQDVLVECYLQGKSYREVAEMTDSTETIIKGRLAQAKKTLRRKLLKRGIALSFVLVMLEQVRSNAVAGTTPPATWAESVRGILSESNASVSTAVKSFSQIGIKRMSMQLLTKPLSLFVFAFVATCVPVMWILNQPILGQDSGISLQDSGAEKQDTTELKVQAADPFGSGSSKAKTSGKKTARPRIQDDRAGDSSDATVSGRSKKAKQDRLPDPFADNDSPEPRQGADDKDPFGGSPGKDPFSGQNPFAKKKQRDPFGASDSATPIARENPKPKRSSRLSGAAAEKKIEMALSEPSEFDFVDTPLTDIADFLSEYYSIAVHIDQSAIEVAGYDEETPFTGTSQKRTLRSALTFLFKDVEFAFVIKNETLVITTHEAISSEPDEYVVSRLYDVSKLASKNSESIVTTIQQSIDADSWTDNGGYAAMNVLNLGNRTVLAITHTSEHQNRVQKLLQSLEQLSGN